MPILAVLPQGPSPWYLLPLLAVPAGAIVRMRENRGTWVEVELGETRGWLPAAALAPVR